MENSVNIRLFRNGSVLFCVISLGDPYMIRISIIKSRKNLKDEVYCLLFTVHQFPLWSGNVLSFCNSNQQASQVCYDTDQFFLPDSVVTFTYATIYVQPWQLNSTALFLQQRFPANSGFSPPFTKKETKGWKSIISTKCLEKLQNFIETRKLFQKLEKKLILA